MENKIEFLDKIKNMLKIRKEDFIAWKVASETCDPFKVLIATLLSQNTTDKNALKAYQRLEEKIGVKPEKLASTSIEEISDAIKVAGLYKAKARAIREIARIILEKYQGDLRNILNLENAREKLLSLPRVGEKTADVLLLMLAGKETIPVDTHIRRVSLRLGIASGKDYSSIQKSLMEYFRGEDFLEVHLYLIALGRTYCKSRRPLCEKCPLINECKYYLSKRHNG